MAHKIISSKTFLKKVIALNIYLETEWNLRVASDFQETLIKIVLPVAEKPGIGSTATKRKAVRKIGVTKHNRLYYRVNENNSITLLNLFDTRQHPRKNRYD